MLKQSVTLLIVSLDYLSAYFQRKYNYLLRDCQECDRLLAPFNCSQLMLGSAIQINQTYFRHNFVISLSRKYVIILSLNFRLVVDYLDNKIIN